MLVRIRPSLSDNFICANNLTFFFLDNLEMQSRGRMPGVLIFSQIFGPTNQIPKELGCLSESSSLRLPSLNSSAKKMSQAMRNVGLGLQFESDSTLKSEKKELKSVFVPQQAKEKL
jgi:hypothetical protein